MKELIFSHSGNMGDILLSLHFVKDYIKWKNPDKAHMVLTYNRPARYLQGHPDGQVQMSEKTAKFVQPFLEQSGLFKEVHCIDFIKFTSFVSQIENHVCLDDFRKKKLNFFSGDSRAWVYSLSNHHFKKDFSEDIFAGKFEGDTRAKDYVLVTNTQRVNNAYVSISMCVCEHKDEIAFIGLDDEYERFCHLIDKKTPRFDIKNAADAARLMKGSKGVIGNQGRIVLFSRDAESS